MQTFTHHSPFSFELGGEIKTLELAYETYGQLSAKKDNVILINHALSTNSHAASHSGDTSPGWWEAFIGPGKAINTDHFYVMCINNLGSCFGSSGPSSIDPNTQTPYQNSFPTFTIKDMVHAQYLLLNSLGITTIHTLIGNSMGGMLSLQWACNYPEQIQQLILTSTCYKAYPANIINRAIQKEIIQLDPLWQQGKYTKNPTEGLKIARKLGHTTYRNKEHLNQRFERDSKTSPDLLCEIEHYFEYNANKFVEKYDANSYLSTLTAMDLFEIPMNGPSGALSHLQAKVLIISVSSDQLFPPAQQIDLHQKLLDHGKDSQLINHQSPYGHDAFLVDVPEFSQFMTAFLKAATYPSSHPANTPLGQQSI